MIQDTISYKKMRKLTHLKGSRFYDDKRKTWQYQRLNAYGILVNCMKRDVMKDIPKMGVKQ